MTFRFEPTTAQQRTLWSAFGLAWIGAVSVGLSMLARYANSPGAQPEAPRQWPADSTIELSKSGGTLLFFAHPHCPCTRASLGELEKIVARCPNAATVWVVFFHPTTGGDDWDQSDLCRTAAAIPGIHVVRDVDGTLARSFHAVTSGQTLLYGANGELQFSGGITIARGHSGDSAGRTAIETCLAGDSVANRRAPVYGCSLAVSGEQDP